jgi:hypothetical protein
MGLVGGFPAAQSFHPEFGYLCPSMRLRRRLRHAAMTIAAGVLVAASGAMAVSSSALLPQGPDAGARPAVAAALQLIDKAAEPPPPTIPTMELATSPTEPPPRVQTACDDLADSFLAPRCQLGKPHQSHLTREARATRAANRRVVPTGRIEEVSASESPPAGLARAEPASAEARLGAAAVVVPLPPARPAMPANKPITTASKPAPDRDKAGTETAAAAPLPEFNFFDLFHLPLRGGNGA